MPSPSLTLLRTQSDDRLVALARAGHERAFEAIVERYRRPLLRAARRVLPEARAEDALQQALIAAWTALGRGDEVRDLRAWLYRIVHNTALNALRVSGYDYEHLEDALRLADASAGDDELERRAVVRQTLASLAALPERQREALLRTAVSGYSQEEVARDLGISDNAMRQLIHRARVTMRTAVTAVTPLPLVPALAAGGRGGPVAERIAELIAGAAPAGAAATLAKAGTVAVIAGGAISGPAIVDRVADRPPRDAKAASTKPARKAKPAAAGRTTRGPARSVAATVTPAGTAPAQAAPPSRAERRRARRRHEGERGSRVRGEDDERESDARRGSDEDEDEAGADREPNEGEDSSGSGSGGESDQRGGGGSSSGSDEGEALESGSEPDAEDVESSSGPLSVEAPEPIETPEPDSHRGPGSGEDESDY
jgi:RNA polymerase sigma factor (sigma-70 family)